MDGPSRLSPSRIILSSVGVVWSGYSPMSNASFRFKPPTWHLIPTTSVPLPCRSRLLNNYCVCFRTSNALIKESAAMQVHPARIALPRKLGARIAPHQLWSHLSVGQQQHVRQVLIRMAQQLMVHRPNPPRTEEATHDPRSQSEPSQNHPATS